MHRMITMRAHSRQTDRRTDIDHGNSGMIRFNEHIALKTDAL